MRLLPNMIGNSDDETNFVHELLLTNKKVANLRKVFANNSSNDFKLSKTQLQINYLISYHHIGVSYTDQTCILFKIKFIILSWILMAYSVIINIDFYINLLHF